MSLSQHPIVKIIIAIIVALAIFVGSFYASSQALLANIFNRSVWITLAIYHTLVLILSFIAILIFSKGKLSSFGFQKAKSFPFIKILVSTIIIGVISGYIIHTFNKEELGFIALYKFWEKIAFIWLLSSLCEEMLVSGFMQSYMMPAKKYAFRIAKTKISLPMVLTALVFATIYYPHLIGMQTTAITLISLSIFFIGLAKAYFREKTESLIAPILMHVLFNIVVFGVVYLMNM